MGFLSTQATTSNIETVSPGILVPSGVVFPFSGSVAPSGYLLCDGSPVSRSVYSALFSVINTIYGNGDGSTTFNLPDYRYSFLRGSALNISVTGSGTAGSNQATFTAHGINRTGMRVRLSSGALSGLAGSTNYFAIVVNENTLAFASTYANAMSNSRISISGSNSAVIIQWEDPDITTRGAVSPGGSVTGVGTRQEDQNISHTHSGSGYLINTGGSGLLNIGAFIGPSSIPPSGGNQSNPRNIYVNYIIKF